MEETFQRVSVVIPDDRHVRFTKCRGKHILNSDREKAPGAVTHMKIKAAFIFLLFALSAVGAFGQAVEDSSRRTIGYISSSGTVEDSSRRTLGYIKDNGTIEDSSRRTLGYIKENGMVEDSSRRTLGYVNPNGSVENSSHSTLGYVNSNGRVDDGSRRTIGYAEGIKAEHAALFFFFFFGNK